MKLSIIIPVYNVEQYLEKCLESIEQQTMKDFEVILVNDGSTDGSRGICEKYQKRDSRFCLINLGNGGPAHARNVGIKAARGKYLGFVDSDDYIEKNMYEMLVESIEKYETDIAICDLEYVNDFGECLNKRTMNIPFESKLCKAEIKEFIIKKYYECDVYGIASLCNKIYRKEFIIKNRLLIDEERVRAEGYWFNMNAYCVADSIIAINAKLYFYVQRKRENIMSSFRTNQFDLFVKTRQELLKLNQEFEFEIDYDEFDYGFIQETSSYIIQLLKNKRGLNRERIITILTSKDYQDAINKCQRGSKPIKLINYFLRKEKYTIVCILYKLWACKV